MTSRDLWLNPPELVRQGPPIAEGMHPRPMPMDAAAAKILAKRTLTNLYNQRPSWLDDLHHDLDVAVFRAYGWPADIADDEILGRLLALNHMRA